MIDVWGSVAILVAISPLLLAIAVVILVRDGRPILFRQNRVGLGGRRFQILKFRTMIPSEKQKPAVYADETWKTGVPDDFVFKNGSNPYVTPTGKFLRKYSLDELPQFFNVLNGSMSLVGPRPEIPEIADYYNKSQRGRLSVKPGITGLAQVSGRSNMNNGRKIELDLDYVRKFSFLLDLRILFATAFNAVRGKDAV